MRPRPCTCDRHRPGFPWGPGDCVLCWTWHNREGFRAAFGHAGAVAEPPRVEGSRVTAAPGPPPPCQPPPCPDEGPVVESATCNCADPESRHVRLCLSADPSAPDKCVRGPSADPAVRSCAACPLRSQQP